MSITQELVKELFDYHEDGYLTWKEDRKGRGKTGLWIKAGERAGTLGNVCSGAGKRYKINIGNKEYLASRMIFLYHEGYLPEFVDHKDRDALNDRIGNLRAATRTENQRNRCSFKNSTSKYKGVDLQRGRFWTAQIQHNKKKMHIGRYATEELAALAYNREAVKYHKEFANLNIILPEVAECYQV